MFLTLLGESVTVDVSDGNCHTLPPTFFDRASSIRHNSGCINLYRDADCGSDKTKSIPEIKSFITSLKSLGWDNDVRSVSSCSAKPAVQKGQVVFYNRPNFQG